MNEDVHNDDGFEFDPDSDLSEKQQLAVHLLSRGTGIKDVSRKCEITTRQLLNWRKKNKSFMSALTVAQVEVSARLIGQMGALSELGMKRVAEVLTSENALLQWNPKDVVALASVLSKHVAAITPKVSMSETRTTKEQDDWNTAPADDGSVIEGEVVENEPVEDE